MIKVNLLNSVTDRLNGSGVAVVEKKVLNPKTQTYFVLAGVCAVMLLVMGFDYVSASAASTRANEELTEQQRIAEQMKAIIKEQNDLAKKTQDINTRIAAIQALRSTQKGPVAVLSAINERIPQVGNFNLEKIDQKGGILVISGDSPSEDAVTQFGRSLEFSTGLFTNVSIEIQRKAIEGITPPAQTNPNAPPAVKAETVSFTIRCSYTPPSAPSTATPAAAAPAK